MTPKRIVIVGGGITGLAAAYAAARRSRELARPTDITVIDAGSRWGGNLVTERVGDFLLDGGPDSWVASKPAATALARELGLEGALVGTDPKNRRYYVAWAGRLHPVPEGIVLGVPTDVSSLVHGGLFTWRGKLRMACEPLVPARSFAGDEDESIESFARRRLGREATERLVAPLLGGISAGDASELSVRAAVPQLVAMEREHGSLVMGMRAAKRARKRDPKANGGSAFLSLQGGVATLVEALVDRLERGGVALRTGCAAQAVSKTSDAWRIAVPEGSLDADSVLLAVPGPIAAHLLSGVDRTVSDALAAMQYTSTATVFLAYRRTDLSAPLDGVGFVVPRSLGRPILAGTWVSSKWAGRAPEGHVLLRVFLGGSAGEDVLARDDSGLSDLARSELKLLMGLDAPPLWSRVFRFDRASAQMRVGHLVRMRRLRERMAAVAPGVRVAGGGYGVVGIPDCINEGREAGRAMAE
jgi:oxygen-dependent protoporphyrinogen oxidase